jgi:hypothetical protein
MPSFAAPIRSFDHPIASVRLRVSRSFLSASPALPSGKRGRHRRPVFSIDVIDALHFLHPTHFVEQQDRAINVGAETVAVNDMLLCRDGKYAMLEAGPPYAKLLKGYSIFFDCGDDKTSYAREVDCCHVCTGPSIAMEWTVAVKRRLTARLHVHWRAIAVHGANIRSHRTVDAIRESIGKRC